MQYYTFTNDFFDDPKFAYGEHFTSNYLTGKAKLCKGCGSFISMLEWLPPFEISVSNKELGDFIFGTYVGFIVSKNFKEKYEKNDFFKSLISFRKVDLYYKKKLLDEQYYNPEIPLINAFVNLDNIEFDTIELCVVCQKGKSIIRKISGVYFIQPNQIDDDVFFTISLGQSNIIVSPNFKDFVLKENFTNIKLLDISKFKWDSLNPIEY